MPKRSILPWLFQKIDQYKTETGREHIVIVKPRGYAEQSVWNIWKKLGEEISPHGALYVVYGSLLEGEPRPNPRKRLQTCKRKHTSPWDIMKMDKAFFKGETLRRFDEEVNKRINSEAS